MAFRAGTSVRFSEELGERLDRVAEAAGLKKADLIRMAVEEYLDHVERAGRVEIEVPRGRRATRRIGEAGYVTVRGARAAEGAEVEYQAGTRAARAATGEKQKRRKKHHDDNDIGPAAR
jgi:predicted transcriptional regulator